MCLALEGVFIFAHRSHMKASPQGPRCALRWRGHAVRITRCTATVSLCLVCMCRSSHVCVCMCCDCLVCAGRTAETRRQAEAPHTPGSKERGQGCQVTSHTHLTRSLVRASARVMSVNASIRVVSVHAAFVLVRRESC